MIEPGSGATSVPALTPPSSEDATSQVPALDLMQQLGWKYLRPDEVDWMRGGRRSEVVLKAVLRANLERLNGFEDRDGRKRAFTEGAIEEAINHLTGLMDDGLVRTNEKIWDLLRLGKSVPQTVDGDRRSYTVRYIDWENPRNNVFYVTEEFAVEAAGSSETRRPDIVGFVNGIPFVVVECKPRALPGGKIPVEEAVSQHLRNQGAGEIPRLYHYAQLLVALAINEAKYAATGTPLRFWHTWRERELPEEELAGLLGPRSETGIEAFRRWITGSRFGVVRETSAVAYGASVAQGRAVTEQDRLLNALCRPERLLALVRSFTVFEGGARKVARYQQYFSVRQTLERLRQRNPDGSRTGGVIWHTQGSGKSLTMVMLAGAILEEFRDRDPRIVLVTDRVDLDDQLYETFRGSGVELTQAESGSDLRRLLGDRRARVVTTLVHKFVRALKLRETLADDGDIFVLVDEGHRTHTGSMHAAMRVVLPHACYVGFTGTPILKGDKATVERFGGIIDAYTIDQAVADNAVVPLVYEGRHVPQDIDARPIDAWFEKYTAALTQEQKSDLKRKYSTADQLNRVEQKIRAEAWDVSVHFRSTFQGTPFKGQLVAPSKADALLYKRFLDEFGIVTSEVLMSAPDTREGYSDVDEVDETANRPSVVEFWERTMKRFGSEENYRRDVIGRFKNADDPEIIIVVDMLLTGFDAPRNSVLYLTRSLKEHTLLQAIARVNRVYEGKDYGLIVDYYGVLGHLDQAMDLYTAFDGRYDADDLSGVLTDIRKAMAELPQRHSELWDVFKTVRHKQDPEAMEQFLGNEEHRHRFYAALSAFARILKLAFSSFEFYSNTPPVKVERYKQDLKFFVQLRASVARRYAEAVDFRQYAGPIQKLLDTYVGAGEVETIVNPVSIFDRDAFKHEVEQFSSPGAKAEVIANRVRHTIHEHLGEDPVFYRKLSDMLKEAYERYERERFAQIELLSRVEKILRMAQERERQEDAPPALAGKPAARTYYEVLGEELAKLGATPPAEDAAALALAIDAIIRRLQIVHWESNLDIQNRMRIEIEDELFGFKDRQELEIPFEVMDRVMDTCIEVARRRAVRQ
jgi:type I restriction enzyme, R subunit